MKSSGTLPWRQSAPTISIRDILALNRHPDLIGHRWFQNTLHLLQRRSATGHLLQPFGIPSPLHRDLGGSSVDFTEIVFRQFD